jgi:copper resistance protein B
MKTAHLAMSGAALALMLPLSCRSAAPPTNAMPEMPDMPEQAMSPVMGMDDTAAIGKVMLDQLELEGGSAGKALGWDGQAWYGADYNKVWIKTEGSPDSSDQVASRNELLWDHTLTRWWDLQTGVRLDLGQGPARGWAAVGVEGLAPYWFDVQATFYLGAGGRAAARFQVEHDLLITQRLIVQPEIETNIYARSDSAREVGSGVSDMQLGLRIRYEIQRELAPYVGVAWRRNLGAAWVAGFHVWF